MSVVRRRYYFWLFRAYIKRWYKAILTSLLAGVVIFFASIFALNFYLLPLLQKKVQKIGYTGVYTTNTIPHEILSDVSYGLTKVDSTGEISPAASFKWDVKNNGQEYTFYLKHGQYFHNGRELTSGTIPILFKDVEKVDIDKYTVKLTLKSSYSPFLTSISAPILDKKLSGLGQFKIKKVDVNGGFVRSLTLEDVKDRGRRKIIMFYPTESALKSAYALGDVDHAQGVASIDIKDSTFEKWPNTKIEKNINYRELVTMFYNNNDRNLSSRKVRQALSYAVPAKFSQGERAYSPIPPTSMYFAKGPNFGISDVEISKSLLSEDKDVFKQTFEITTTPDYVNVALAVAEGWKELGIKTKIKTVDTLPSNFQILIYPIKLPADPDQYTLWHSIGVDNIANYRINKRIDKLLEDGRSITDPEARLAIYADFQKYLIDDAPATFLYFPKNYNISRK